MTRYPSTRQTNRRVVRVASFRNDRGEFTETPLRPAGCLVRVTHASVGSTDLMARRGDYLLHPLPGFVSGYDFVGVLEAAGRPAARFGLRIGQRVAGVLPDMGAHATHLAVPASLLVPVPEGLSSEIAATLPLDAVTARLALDLLGRAAGSIFISGISGAVGLLAAQLARDEGLAVIGTASPESARAAVEHGATVIDYHDGSWAQRVLDEFGPVGGAIDHTGSADVRRVVAPGGRLVRTAFGGSTGHQRRTTAAGIGMALARWRASPRELICSAPIHVAVRRARYRDELGDVLDLVANGRLTPPEPVLHEAGQFPAALEAARQHTTGTKVVLTFGD